MIKNIDVAELEISNDPIETLDHLAQPFLDLAKKLEEVRLNGTDTETWTALGDANVFYWRLIVNYLPKHFASSVSPASKAMLEMIADFMLRASKAMRHAPDTALLAQMVQLNLNMSDQILSIAEKIDNERMAA
ncbi:hypothetical protein [Curvivirga sp.]|uniref:hypothetical protein n=1 Tax=Curvivirga sp. TaxID=2856848 RepID=UPI003B59966D